MKKHQGILAGLISISILTWSCTSSTNSKSNSNSKTKTPTEVIIEGESLGESQNNFIKTKGEGNLTFNPDIPVAGRYKTQIKVSSEQEGNITCWIEDYVNNTDERTYNITGNLTFSGATKEFITIGVDGSPLNKGVHEMKIHFSNAVKIDWIKFTLIKPHDITPVTMTQKMDGDEWNIVWADEFEGTEIDTGKWTYDIGDWGWGNHELQYYTKDKKENARIEDGNLIIEAHKNATGDKWTSARLTTRGKVSFKYGKIEFRAKVPAEKGNWAAGWTLGDTYVDEISWPYCGEIDILESVGFEMDDKTGNGIAHASVHSRAFYFKVGNQVTATQNLQKMDSEYHTYACEWTPDYIYMLVDDIHYFTYEKTDIENSWPFDIPQNIILNLAMGGGWGGAQGMHENITKQTMTIDYIRVYEKR